MEYLTIQGILATIVTIIIIILLSKKFNKTISSESN